MLFYYFWSSKEYHGIPLSFTSLIAFYLVYLASQVTFLSQVAFLSRFYPFFPFEGLSQTTQLFCLKYVLDVQVYHVNL